MINDARGDDSRAFASHFTSSIGATAAAAVAAAASAAAAGTMCRDRARVSMSKRPSAAAHVRGREEIETMNDARGDAAFAQLCKARARFHRSSHRARHQSPLPSPPLPPHAMTARA